MQLPLSWLKSLFPHNINSQNIADTLTKAGIEVDLVESFNPPFSGVVCAKVESCEPHPDANKLQVTKVFDGTNHYQVVCGAKNCRKGLIVAFAKPGAVLGDKDPFVIQEKAVRGVHSQGMLCSADELGLTTVEEPGIIELDESYTLGSDFKSLVKDEIFHISITPNLGHVLSVLGIARELSAFLKLPLNLEKAPLRKDQALEELAIKIDSSDCTSYHAYKLLLTNRTQTPFLIQQRLRLAGFQPKNLVVDILNYVMFERGQPMHAFDADKLSHGSLHIKNLSQPKEFKALNGKTYQAPSKTLAIMSDDHIAAIAGVMGSDATSCQEVSSQIILESAAFSSQAIRYAIKSLDLRTDAANRFEKGIDLHSVKQALDLAVALIVHYSQAKLVGGFDYQKSIKNKTQKLRTTRTNKLLGCHLTQNEIAELLNRLDMPSEAIDQDSLQVQVPSYRNDITIEEDLVEEVGRLYGLDHLKGHLSYQATVMTDHPLYTFEKPVKKALFAQGLQEILTCDLLSKDLATDFKLDKGHSVQPIVVLHPRSLDQCTLRMSLLASFIPVIQKNFSNKETNLSLFEVGKIHAKSDDKYKESLQAAFVLTGLAQPYYFDPKAREYDFFDLKGIVEGFLDDLGIVNYELKISHDPVFHPYQQMCVYKDNELMGMFGQLHPQRLKKYDIDKKVFYAEFSCAELLKHQKQIYPAKLAPTQPYIERDWTAILKEETSFSELLSSMQLQKPEITESISLLDIYPQGDKKNITLRVRYRHAEKTLESTYIDQIHQNFIADVAKKLDLSL